MVMGYILKCSDLAGTNAIVVVGLYQGEVLVAAVRLIWGSAADWG